MARPMQLTRTGSPKEDIVAKLMRTAFLIGLASTWRPGAAAAQYSWSNSSVSVGLRTGSARLGIGASYTAVDPLYDVYFEDPCWEVPARMLLGARPHPRSPELFRCFGEPVLPPPAASLLLALRLLQLHPFLLELLYKESPQAGSQRVATLRSIASVRTTPTRSITDRRARASSALSSVRDRAAPQPRRRATSVAAPSRAQAPRGPAGVADARSARARPSEAVSRGAAPRTDGLSARRANPTRVFPRSQATTRRPATSSDRELTSTTRRSAPTSAAGPNRPSRAPTTGRAASPAPTDAGPQPTSRSRSGAAQSRPESVTRSRALRERAPAPQSTPNTRPQTSGRPQANTASPSPGRAARPSAAPRATAPRARILWWSAPGELRARGRPHRPAVGSMQRPRR